VLACDKLNGGRDAATMYIHELKIAVHWQYRKCGPSYVSVQNYENDGADIVYKFLLLLFLCIYR
jgi:hypothetical protein